MTPIAGVQVEELQKTLGDAKVILFDEREQVLRLQAENDSLKNQEIEDRKRIQHLLVMTEPVTREVRFGGRRTGISHLLVMTEPVTSY